MGSSPSASTIKIRLSLKGSLIFIFRDSNLKVLRRLENIVVCHRLRKSAALHTRYFLRARRRKQLSTVSYSLTHHFDQNKSVKSLDFTRVLALFIFVLEYYLKIKICFDHITDHNKNFLSLKYKLDRRGYFAAVFHTD